MALCRNRECVRVIAPGAEYCCGSCMLAAAVGYSVPDTDSLGHTDLCETRQRATAAGVSS